MTKKKSTLKKPIPKSTLLRKSVMTGKMSAPRSDSAPEYAAPAGTVWVCGACGKYGKNRMDIGDESCFMNSILCREDDTLMFNERGSVISAQAVKEESSAQISHVERSPGRDGVHRMSSGFRLRISPPKWPG